MRQHLLTVGHQHTALLLLSRFFPWDLQQRSSSPADDACQTIKSPNLSVIVPTTASSTTVAQDGLNDRFGTTPEDIGILTASVTMFADEARKLTVTASEQSQIVLKTSERLSALKISIEESNSSATASELNLQILREQLHSLQSTYTEKRLTSYDGTLVWKITDVSQKMSR